MDQVGELGTQQDRDQREKLVRVDTQIRRDDINLARSFMFTRGDGPTAKAVEDVLGPESRVPNHVGEICYESLIY